MRLEKKDWISPRTNYQEFTPQEFIAGCWIVHCNVNYGYGWVDSNNNNQLDNGESLVSPTRQQSQPGADGYYGTYVSSGWNKTVLSYVQGCQVEHKGVSIGHEGPTANAKWQNVNQMGGVSGKPYLVYAWVDRDGGHATKIESAEWQTNPNAS